MTDANVTLRPCREEDDAFLFALYASTREAELAPVPWSDAQKVAFLRQQFEAQHRWWRDNYLGSTFDVIEVDGTSAGRLYVHRTSGEHRIIDIALMPAFQGRGIGGALLRGVLGAADRSGALVSLHVESFNPARRLYERLGFVRVGGDDIHMRMERPSPGV